MTSPEPAPHMYSHYLENAQAQSRMSMMTYCFSKEWSQTHNAVRKTAVHLSTAQTAMS